MKRSLAAILALLPAVALAAAAEQGGSHHAEGIPTVIIYQVINVVILVAGLIYYTKDGIVQSFAERRAAYVSAAKKSAIAREEAELQFLGIKNKIAHLEATEADAIVKAKTHAEEIKAQILIESKNVSARIRSDAALTAQLETKKAQKELREQLLKDSVEAARTALSRDIGSNDHQKLQGDFIKNIEVVG